MSFVVVTIKAGNSFSGRSNIMTADSFVINAIFTHLIYSVFYGLYDIPRANCFLLLLLLERLE